MKFASRIEHRGYKFRVGNENSLDRIDRKSVYK